MDDDSLLQIDGTHPEVPDHYDWKGWVDQLNQLLRLRTTPIGMKLFETVAAMDVLAPGIGEIIGGAQREERLDVLDSRLEEMGLAKEDYWWYRDLRRYGTVPHAGFGLGFERTTVFATGMTNVRDVIPFPRTPNSAEF